MVALLQKVQERKKRIGKKEEEIRAPGMLKTTKIHRSIYNDKKKKNPLVGFCVFAVSNGT